jgi:hypothetical protein
VAKKVDLGPMPKWHVLRCRAPMSDGECGFWQRYRVILADHPPFEDPTNVQKYVSERLGSNFTGFIEHHVHKQHPAEFEVVMEKIRTMITYLTVKKFQPFLKSEVENEDGSTTAGTNAEN